MPPLIKVGDQPVLVETKKYPFATFPFVHFNPVQSRIFEFYDQDCNAVIAAATSAGKAQPDDTPVLTPHGYRRLDAILVGDEVIGGNGRPVKVVGVFPQGVKPVYQVVFNDGSKTRCCEDHLWAVRTRSQKASKLGFVVKPLGKLSSDEPGKYHIPDSPVVHFAEKRLGLHPYVFGMLLGDGSVVYGSRLTVCDPATKAKFVSHLPPEVSLVQDRGSKSCDYRLKGDGRVEPIYYELDQLGLAGLKSYQKFIPSIYLYGSVEQRQQLLAGLMDSDGGCSAARSAEFNTSSLELAKNVEFLVRSLGGWTRIRKKGRVTYKYKGELRNGRPCYRLTVGLGRTNPFGSGRRRDLFDEKCRIDRHKLRTMDSFQPAGEAYCRCIKVDNEDGLYITEDMVVTHNTIVGEMFANHELEVRKGTFMYLCPLRALAQEKVDDWTDPTHPFSKKKVAICTGDYRLTPERQKEIAAAEVIIMTSEMLNHRCRNFKAEGNNFLQNIGTIVVDECFSEDSTVVTDSGVMSFGEIIDSANSVSVLCRDNVTGEVGFQKVLASQKKLLKREWVTLHYDGGHVQVTGNQLVWVNGAYCPANRVKPGDIVEVLVEKTEQCGFDSRGRADDVGIAAGRRACSSDRVAEFFGEVSLQSVTEARTSRSLEVRSVEKAGWHPTADTTQRRLRAFRQAIYDTLVSRDQESLPLGLSKRQEDGQSGVAGSDFAPAGFGCVAHGRRQHERQHVTAHGGIFAYGERASSMLAGNSMGVREQVAVHEALLANSLHSAGEGTLFRPDTTLRHSVYDVQNRISQPTSPLSLLWQNVLDFEKGEVELQNLSVLRREELFASTEAVLLRLEQESVCCDLQVAACNNLFVSTGGVSVLAHNSHLLTVPGRGDHLEVGLMKLTKMNPKCRIIMLSATMPNVDEIAEWVSYNLTKRNTYVLISHYRPCPLTTHFDNYGDDENTYDKKEESKIARALEIVQYYPDDKFLVFCHTKRTGEQMSKDMLRAGIKNEFHNADLDKDKRISLEKRFKTDPALRVVVATSTLAWGVNLPARRVIVLGVHRGMSEVATYDIFQMIGRAGRPAYDPAGDAYILVPQTQAAMWRARLKAQQRIESQLLENMGGNFKLLAFHIVSEIHHGNITCEEDVRSWFERTLAHFQSKELDDTAVGNVIDLLKKCYAIMDEDGKLKATSIGVISSMFYFSPFDVSHLKQNFGNLFKAGQENDDMRVALALGNIDSMRMGFTSRAEREELVPFQLRLKNAGVEVDKLTEGAVKAAFMYNCLLTGSPTSIMAGAMRGLMHDSSRLLAVVQALDGMGSKWGMRTFLETLEKRVRYGVPAHLIELIGMPHLGHVRANNLFKAGIKNLEDLVDAKVEDVMRITKMSKKLVSEVIEEANIKMATT